MNSEPLFGLFGNPLHDLVAVPPDAVQFSPVVPGARALEDLEQGTLAGLVMSAPPGTLERRYTLAAGLRALRAGGSLTALAPKTKGGNRLAKELEAFGCEVEAWSARHHRFCRTRRPAVWDAEAENSIAQALRDGAPRFLPDVNLWSQPGVFSWDRIDQGSALLLRVLPALSGRGADLGCGLGVLARKVLEAPLVTALELIDIDRRAITAAKQNVTDGRAVFHWADIRKLADMRDLDFVVMNPPFHDGGLEDRALGEAFVRQAQRMLRPGGVAWLVANLHLPYETILAAAYSKVDLRAEEQGYKVYEATK